MEEDIKILEEWINEIISGCENHYKELGYVRDLYYDGDEIIPVDKYKTVLNLIKRNKKLEEELENSIPKSYIEEQLDFLEKMKNTSEEVSGFWSKRAMLKKFLKYKRKKD